MEIGIIDGDASIPRRARRVDRPRRAGKLRTCV